MGVHFKHFDANLLIQMYHLVRILDVMVGHLADVDEAVLMHANIDKSTKSGDVGDDAVEGHTSTQVVDGADVLVELKSFEVLAWVATRLV